MTETQRAAMQAALGALQSGILELNYVDKPRACIPLHEARIALRAALAEPAEISDVDLFVCDLCGKAIPDGVDPWHFSTHSSRHNHACDECVSIVPIFKPQQPAKVPLLTDADIRKIADKADDGQESAEYTLAFARAIEAAVCQKAGLA
jgi:integrase